jgi:hypothetical protein
MEVPSFGEFDVYTISMDRVRVNRVVEQATCLMISRRIYRGKPRRHVNFTNPREYIKLAALKTVAAYRRFGVFDDEAL